MRKLTGIFLLFVFLFLSMPVFSATAESSPDTVTLSEAIRLALQNSPKILNHAADDELARVNERDAWIAYEQAKANYQNTGGKIDAYKNAMDAAKMGYDAAVNARKDGVVSLANLKEQVEYETESQYFALLNMENMIKTMEESYKLQANMSKIESIKFNLGMSTQFALDKQRQTAMEMERQLTSLYNARTSLKWQFNRNMGNPAQKPLSLASVTFEAVEHEKNQQAGEIKAKDASLAITQFNRTIEDKNKAVQEYRENASDKVEKIELEVRKIDLLKDDLEFGISISMKALHENLYLAQQKLIDARYTGEMAQKDLEAQKIQYELGIIPKILFDADNAAYLQKQADYEKAVYDYYLAARQVSLGEKGIFMN